MKNLLWNLSNVVLTLLLNQHENILFVCILGSWRLPNKRKSEAKQRLGEKYAEQVKHFNCIFY